MNVKFPVATLLLLGLAAFAGPQERAPQLLMQAAHCLVAKDFLPSSRATKLTLGYVVDEKSYPPNKVIYVINYRGAQRSDGLVFAVFLAKDEGQHEGLDIQKQRPFRPIKQGEKRSRLCRSSTRRYLDPGTSCIRDQANREAAEIYGCP
jgi:hypothetical protein